MLGHATRRRTQSEHVVVGRGIAQRPAHVAAVGHRQHAQRKRNRGAAAGSAGADRRVVGIAGGPEDRVVGLRPETELGHVRLADDDRAGAACAFDDDRVLGGDLVTEDRRAHRGAQAARGRQVLDRLRKAVHPAEPLAARQLRVARVGLRKQRVAVEQRHDRVVSRIVALDGREIGQHHVAAGDVAATDRGREFDGVEGNDVRHGDGRGDGDDGDGGSTRALRRPAARSADRSIRSASDGSRSWRTAASVRARRPARCPRAPRPRCRAAAVPG